MEAVKQKQRVVVICPGRGTYNKEELGYLKRLHGDKVELISLIDDYRDSQEQISVSQLDDMEKYSMRQHTAGENASVLIYACAMADFIDINKDDYDVVAVTGNSMGWYIALAVSGALPSEAAIKVINTMGSMMTDGVIGGQVIYPITDEDWLEDQVLIRNIEHWMNEVNAVAQNQVYLSIQLGGYIVFGGNDSGLKALEEKLPPLQDRYPMRLFNHAAFHTPLLAEISSKAKQQLNVELFQKPEIPLIDGLGQIWQPYSCDINKLFHYTLGTQVVEPYNFSQAINVAIKEFSPDKLIILGPGSTLGGATGQCLVKNNWLDMESKQDFIEQQKKQPFVMAMGIAEQRSAVI